MTNKTQIHDLILYMARGNRSAHAEFDMATRDRLIQSLTREFGNELDDGDIQEIVSHSILNMFLHAGGYRGKNGEASAWAWAYRIARNQALKWSKTKRRDIQFPESSDGLNVDEEKLYRMVSRYNPGDVPVSVDEQVEDRLFREKAVEILGRLNEREKLILYLHYEMEWTLKKIAEHLNISPPRVTQVMQSIRKFCQEEMVKSA